MRGLKSVIQNIADRINDPIVEDNISAIKVMAIEDKRIQEAIQDYRTKQEQITSNTKSNENTIVSGDDIRREMNREIGD